MYVTRRCSDSALLFVSSLCYVICSQRTALLYSCLVSASVLASKELNVIILSGGPASVRTSRVDAADSGGAAPAGAGPVLRRAGDRTKV